MEEIAREHPQYGLPRIMAELRGVYDCGVNHKVVERLLRLWDLRIMRGPSTRPESHNKHSLKRYTFQSVFLAHYYIGVNGKYTYERTTTNARKDAYRRGDAGPYLREALSSAYRWNPDLISMYASDGFPGRTPDGVAVTREPCQAWRKKPCPICRGSYRTAPCQCKMLGRRDVRHRNDP